MYKIHERRTYLAIGDSTTWTVAQNFYPSIITKNMSQDIGFVRLINKGIGGTNSRRLLKLINEYALRNEIDLITICVGMNDCASLSIPLVEFETNVGEMVERVRRSNPKAEILLIAPVIATEPSRLPNIASYRTKVSDVATAKGCLFYNPNTLWTTSMDNSYLYTRQFISGNRLTYAGTYNATTNIATLLDGSTKSLASSVGVAGEYYRVTTAGSITLNGVTSLAVDDAIIFNTSIWAKRLASNITWANVRQVMRCVGTWDANTNTITYESGESGSASLVSGTGITGNWVRVDVAGTTTIDTIATWAVNDVAYFNGVAWIKEVLDWIHPIQSGTDLVAAGLYSFIQANSKFYKRA